MTNTPAPAGLTEGTTPVRRAASWSPRVTFGTLERQHAELLPMLRRTFERVVRCNGFILGEEVERFETDFASYCGVDHCVGVASGTAALTVSLLAAGIGRGDEVVVPAHTFVASALAVIHAGARPVICDVDAATGLIDCDAAASVVTRRTAAILAVHLYGQACDMAALRLLARARGLLLVEDAAQAHGARACDRRVGSLGDVAGFSFYPSKNLGALGDGGAICTNDGELAGRARRLRDLGRLGSGEHLVPGFNERLDAMQAAFLRVKLPFLDEWNERRRALAAAYRNRLAGRVRLLEERAGARCVYHLFPIRVSDRDELAVHLERAGVQTGVHYPVPIHRQPALSDHLGGARGFPAAEAWAAEELSLPLYPELEPSELERVATACIAALDGREQGVT